MNIRRGTFASIALIVMIGLTMVSASAYADAPSTLKMSVGIGLGYQLCPERKAAGLPDLQDAFLCSGLQATPQKIELELQNKPAAKPEWLFYEAPYKQTIQFKDITVTVEMLVMYAKYNGKTSGYVDGRVISEQNGKQSAPVYFRSSAEGGLDKLTYSSTYGTSSPVPLSNGTTGQFSPFIVIDNGL